MPKLYRNQMQIHTRQMPPAPGEYLISKAAHTGSRAAGSVTLLLRVEGQVSASPA